MGMNNMNPFMSQLSMNPILMQQYYMVMQNPNLNPQMYAYFMQMMQMNGMSQPVQQPISSFVPQVNNGFMNNQQNAFPLNNVSPSPMSPNLQKNLQINTNFSYGNGNNNGSDLGIVNKNVQTSNNNVMN